MNHNEDKFEKKLQKFSVVKKCPRCGKLSLKFEHNEIVCENCGYEQKIPSVR